MDFFFKIYNLFELEVFKRIFNFNFQIFFSVGFNVLLYDIVVSQLINVFISIEVQLCDMEFKGLMRSLGMIVQEVFKLVVSCDDLEKVLDGVMYVQVGISLRFLLLDLLSINFFIISIIVGLYFFKGFFGGVIVFLGCQGVVLMLFVVWSSYCYNIFFSLM